jgi:hypothetical protein|tara:strand:- start:1998 stop:2627 length:630 start_codon:yes stop_codon:yes gene_type:complete
MTERLSPDLKEAHRFIRLITLKWNEVGEDLSMELRALSTRPQSFRFNPEKEDEVAAVLRAAAELNASGANIYATVNPAGPFKPDWKTRALKDADIIAATATFLDADERGIADNLPDKALAKPDFAVITGLVPFTRAHFYWLSPTPVSDLDQWRWFQQELARRYGTDAAVCNPSRVLRVPGFVTHPNATKVAKGYVSEMTRLVVSDGDLA